MRSAALAVVLVIGVVIAGACGDETTGGAGCERDTDCKGDRICEKGECVDAGGSASGGGGCGPSGCSTSTSSPSTSTPTVGVTSTTGYEAPCVSKCDQGAVCGPDGCGGPSCGTCAENQDCIEGQCRQNDWCDERECAGWFDCCDGAPFCHGIAPTMYCSDRCGVEFDWCTDDRDCCEGLTCEPFSSELGRCSD